MRKGIPPFKALLCSVFFALSFGSAHADPGVDWLSAQSNADGSVTSENDIALAEQATSETLRSFFLKDEGSAQTITSAQNFLAAQSFQNTEYLSRQIIALVDAGQSSQALISKLLSHQNRDGGFGDQAGYQSNVLDTAYAIDALTKLSGNEPVLGSALEYLKLQQYQDGGWGNESNGTITFDTALALGALFQFKTTHNVGAALQAGSNALLSQRNADGLWGEDFLSALSLISLVAAVSDVGSIEESADNLQNRQRADGSWASDVYTTALALRALKLYSLRKSGSTVGNDSGVVEGYIKHAGSAEPVANAVITLASLPGLSGQSNGDGYFTISGIEPGDHTLQVNKTGYTGVTSFVQIQAGRINNAGEIVIGRSTSTAVLAGVVTDAQTGVPVAGSSIGLSGPADYSVITDNRGEFEITAVEPGGYQVEVLASGYYVAQGSVTLESGQRLLLNQVLNQEGTYQDPTPTDLYGVVTDGESGQPINNARFLLNNGQQAISASDGGFRITGVNRGSYDATLSATGYATQQYSIQLPPGASGNLGELRLFVVEDTQAATTLTLKGHVQDGLSNNPISTVTATVTGTGETAVSDANGDFVLSGLESLSFELSLQAEGYATRVYQVEASGYGEVSGTFTMSPGGDSNATSTLLQGVVTNQETDEPISDVLVQLVGTDYSATTGSNGAYLLDGIDTLEFEFSVSAIGYAEKRQHVELSQHGNYVLDVSLEPTVVPGDNFQIVSLELQTSNIGASSRHLLQASIANLTANEKEVVITGEVLDGEGIKVAELTPYAPGTEEPQATFVFLGEEKRQVTIPWHTAQVSPGSYRIIIRVVTPGTITRGVPSGEVLAERSTYAQVISTPEIDGRTDFSPPLTQAGSQNPVQLRVFMVNSGNENLASVPMRLRILREEEDVELHSAAAILQELDVTGFTYLDFGEWISTEIGDHRVIVTAEDGQTGGEVSGTLYVGDKAAGVFTLDKQVVPTGDQTAQATLEVSGVDSRLGTTDPLFFAVQEAIKDGGDYVGPAAKNWHLSKQCLGCHVQTQSHFGMAASLRKEADVSEEDTKFLYNSIASAQHPGGSIQSNYSQTGLGIWSLIEWPDKERSFHTLYDAVRYMHASRRQSGDQTYWNTGSHSWWRSTDAMSMMAAKGYADVVNTATNLDLSELRSYSLAQLSGSMGSGSRPLDLEAGPDGALYTVKYSSDRITRYWPDSDTVETVAIGLPTQCYGIAVAQSGVMYTGCRGQVLQVNPDGSRQTLASLSSLVTDVEISSDGFVYAADYTNNRIWKISQSGQKELLAAGGLLNRPYGLETLTDGSVLVANYGNNNILKITALGEVSIYAEGFNYRPVWLSMSDNGDLFVSHTTGSGNTDGLLRVTPDGLAERVLTMDDVRGLANLNGTIYAVNDPQNRIYRLDSVQLDTSELQVLQSEIPRIVRYFLNRYRDNSTDNFVQASRITALGELRQVVTDQSLLNEINLAIDYLRDLLIDRQRSDGGWGWRNNYASDPMATAFVGLGLDYADISVDNPVTRKTIEYLLNIQRSDGSWYSNNRILGTRLAATSMVMAYLPTALGKLGGLDTDLHLSFPSNIQLSNISMPPSGNVPNQDGGRDYTWTLEAVTASNPRTITFDLFFQDMKLHEERSAANDAYLISKNSFNNEEVRVNLEIPVLRADDGLSLDVVTDRKVYGANQTVDISAPVYNVGPVAQSGYVNFDILSAKDGSLVAQLQNVGFSPVESGGQTAVTTQWQTGSTVAGPYLVHAELYDQLDRHADSDETDFEIRHVGATSELSLRTTTDKPVYHTTDNVDIGNLVRNLTENTFIDNSRLRVEVRDPNGVVSFTKEVPLDQLGPGNSREVPMIYLLQAVPTGDYLVLGQILDYQSNVLADDNAAFEVVDDQSRSLGGEVEVLVPVIDQGEIQTCTDIVRNSGTLSYASLDLRRQVVRLDEEAVAYSQVETVDLPSGSELSLVRDFDTKDLPIGDYACTLEARINNDWHPLAHAVFKVKEPPIRIEAEFSLGGKGRVLILLDENTAPGQGQNDPHGTDTAPPLDTQRAYLEALLTAKGFSYTIVTTGDAFLTELRTGAYHLYGLFSEQEKISEQGQKELREAIYRAEGLLVAGHHDNRHDKLDDPLGIKYIGKHPDASGIEVDPSAWHRGGLAELVVRSKALRAELDGAAEAGRFSIDGSGKSGPNHAVTVHSYGQGKAAYVGYDLLAEATLSDNHESLHAELITGALTHVQPAFVQGNAGQVVPLTLSLTNQGIAITGQVAFSLPDGFEMIDSTEAALDENGTWLWPFSLVEEEVETLAVWVRLPDDAGLQSIEALVQVDFHGSLRDHTTATVEIDVQPRAGLAEALGHPSLNEKAFKTTKQHLDKAEDWLLQGRIDKALFEHTQAADALMAVDHQDAPTIRVMTDQALFDAGRLL